AGSLDDEELRRLHRTARSTVRRLHEAGGSHLGRLQASRSRGRRCPLDGAELQRRTIGGRTTYSCPVHQVGPRRPGTGGGAGIPWLRPAVRLRAISVLLIALGVLLGTSAAGAEESTATTDTEPEPVATTTTVVTTTASTLPPSTTEAPVQT